MTTNTDKLSSGNITEEIMDPKTGIKKIYIVTDDALYL